jgi:uncharacterized lipoprotein YddW (UPF0748 family)
MLLLSLVPVSARSDAAPRRGLFVSLIQDPPVLTSRREIVKLIDFAKKARVSILFVQIYRANQAWFPSKVGDSSPYKAALQKISEDPFKLLINEAHSAGIEVHAWLNMLSLGVNSDAPLLKKYGSGILTRNLKAKKTLNDYKIDNQFFLEPGDLRIRNELLILVEEILRSYPKLDGIQFDYLRYPDMHPAYGYTEMNVERFKKATGIKTVEEESEVWKNWKRNQVTGLLEELVKKSRALRPNIRVSVTGCMPYTRAYYEAFQDWPSWIDRELVDFVTIMSYSPDPLEFEQWIKTVKPKVADPKKMNIAIGAYKSETSLATFAREMRFCEESGVGACVVFHYGSLVENPALGRSFTGGKK